MEVLLRRWLENCAFVTIFGEAKLIQWPQNVRLQTQSLSIDSRVIGANGRNLIVSFECSCRWMPVYDFHRTFINSSPLATPIHDKKRPFKCSERDEKSSILSFLQKFNAPQTASDLVQREHTHFNQN